MVKMDATLQELKQKAQLGGVKERLRYFEARKRSGQLLEKLQSCWDYCLDYELSESPWNRQTIQEKIDDVIKCNLPREKDKLPRDVSEAISQCLKRYVLRQEYETADALTELTGVSLSKSELQETIKLNFERWTASIRQMHPSRREPEKNSDALLAAEAIQFSAVLPTQEQTQLFYISPALNHCPGNTYLFGLAELLRTTGYEPNQQAYQVILAIM